MGPLQVHVGINDNFINMSLFSRIQEEERDMTVELGKDATYLVRGVGSISFQMLSSVVLELDHFYLL